MKHVMGIALALFCTQGCRRQPSAPSSANLTPLTSSAPRKGQLTQAAAAGDLTLVRSLLSQGADINENLSPDGNAVTPLLAAIANQRSETAEYLIRNHAAQHFTFEGYGARDFAKELEQTDLIELLGGEGN